MNVYLEVVPAPRPGVAAHAPAAAGLVGFGADEAEALADLDRGSRLYARVLESQGVPPRPLGARPAWRVAGRLRGRPFWRSGEATSLLPTDLRPLSDRRIRRVLRIVRALRAVHLAELARRGPAAYARRPGRGRRSPGQTLTHLANCEWWYCSRLDDRLPEPGRECPRETRARLAHLLDFAEGYLLSLSAAARRRVVTPRRHPTADPGEKWTAGKVLRRLAEHEFEHLRALLGWRPPMRG